MLSRERVNEERLAALLGGSPDGDEHERELARRLRTLRDEAPSAPDALRERVRSTAAAEATPPPRPRTRISPRRAVLVIAAACLVAALGAAVIKGVSTVADPGGGDAGGGGGAGAGGAVSQEAEGAGGGGDTALSSGGNETVMKSPAPDMPSGSLPPTPGRAQDYRVFLRLRVDDADDLSRKTKQALRLTRSYGGYVVAVRYGVGREGDARLVLRIPIRRVQDAVVRFSNLGTILEQHVSIRDLQGYVDRSTRLIVRVSRRIAVLRSALANPGLSADERARFEDELVWLEQRLAALRRERSALVRRASFAKVSLALTTRDPAADRDESSRIERAVRDAGTVLSKEIAYGAYFLIVAAPFILVAALGVAAARVARRRADQRVLERA